MSRIDELQAAALRVKLSRFGETEARRRKLRDAFDESLPRSLSRVGRDADGEPSVHLYVVRVEERARLRAALTEAGIGTGVHYPIPVHRMAAFAGARKTPLPVSERACAEVLSLPFFPSMPIDAVARVCAALETST
jgi:dTDP-3-amino-3,4,6-trideoxy-alpha-D-glucose transaminase